MGYFVDKSTLNIIPLNKFKYTSQLGDFQIKPDTEFTQHLKMIVDCIGLYAPQLCPEGAFIFTYDELTDDFHPILKCLEVTGHTAYIADNEYLNDIMTELGYLQDEIIDENKSSHEIRKSFQQAFDNSVFDDFLTKYNLPKEYLKLVREHKISRLEIQPPIMNVELGAFFLPADLFKIWGKNHQNWLLQAKLAQYRSLRFTTNPCEYIYINGMLYQLNLAMRDTMYRFPPKDKSLEGQAKTFGLSSGKIKLVTDENARRLGLSSASHIKSNMSLVREKMFETFLPYNAVDIFLTDELDTTQRGFLSIIRKSFNLNDVEINDTTGANVSKFIKDIIYREYGISENDKKGSSLLKEAFSLSKVDNLQDIALNNFGIQPFLTVGGLLFTRMPEFSFLKGLFGDLDLVSCYSTVLSNLNVYIGEPVTLTFKYEKYKPTLGEIIEFIELKKPPKDGWFVRVSGTLDKAFNTLIMSDLKFQPKNIKIPTKYDIPKDRKSIEWYNADKTSKKQAVSTILLKQIKFGLINHDLLECLKLLPDEWYEEYKNLKCDALVYVPPELIADNLDDYQKIRSTLPDEPNTEKFRVKEGTKGIEQQYCKANVCLRFPIWKYWQQLAAKRKEFKSAKNPVQEVYKLFGNSGYGVLACLYLTVNNLLASNMVTAKARCGNWLMTNSVNGFTPITDGSSFSWLHIPLKSTFRKILSQNPHYVFKFDPTIQSGLTQSDIGQAWIDKNFKKHLARFYGIDINHPLVQMFEHELKTESFLDRETVETLEAMKSLDCGEVEISEFRKKFEREVTFFTKYYNTNAGNYVKGMDDSLVLIEDTDYDFTSQESSIKARSFQGSNQSLVRWYADSLEKGYKAPLIYSENKIFKLGDGNQVAIKFLEEGIDEICHPMGFSTTTYKMMKLISRSQFLFLNESQLKNFETNENTLSELSNHILNKQFWLTLDASKIAEYGAEIRENVDYYTYSRYHSVGVGFELLSLMPKHKGSLDSVRRLISEKILEGCQDFNASLHISRSFKEPSEALKHLLAAVIVLKKNAENDLKQCLINSVNEPTLLTVRPENVKTLQELWSVSEDDD